MSFVCFFEYYVGVVDKFDGWLVNLGFDYIVFMVCELVGVIGYIILWNYLIFIFVCGVVLVFVVGCLVVVKLVEIMLFIVFVMMEFLFEVGVLDGLVNVVIGFGFEVGV